MLINSSKIWVISFATLLYSGFTVADSLSPVAVDATLNLTLNPGLDSTTIDTLAEGKFFVDINYLDKLGGGVGVIQQKSEYKLSTDISNQIAFANLWFGWYPSSLNGKVSTVLDYFDSNENEFVESVVTTTNSGQGQGQGQGSTITTVSINTYTETFSIVNPSVSYLNNDKTFFVELSYAKSDYESDQAANLDLEVEQWAPAVGFGFNENYDWVQVRYYGVNLSSDVRSAGVENTDAISFSWTHWFKGGASRGLYSTNITVLAGEKIFGVEQDVRKVFDISDVQTGSVAAGVTWRLSSGADFSAFVGYEQYEDVNNDFDYDNTFVDLALVLHW